MALAQPHAHAHAQPLPLQKLRPGHEKRATQRALAYWESIRDEGALPKFGDFRFAHREVNDTARFLLKQDHVVENSVFILCGDTVASSFGGSPVRKTLSESAPDEMRDRLSADCAAAVAGAAPAGSEGWYLSGQSDRRIYYRYIFLPMDASCSRLGYVFGAYSCKDGATG